MKFEHALCSSTIDLNISVQDYVGQEISMDQQQNQSLKLDIVVR